ncbi:MAG: hypothetical protein AAB853_03895 [Patescibacteria group bacterium]
MQQKETLPSDIYGPLTATGTVTSTGASLYRRGTHVLMMDGQSRFFLESRTVDLRHFEEKEAIVRGELELNTHASFLPVLVVTDVEPIAASEELQESQRFDVPSLHLSLEAPGEWQGSLSKEQLLFRLEDNDPFLVISIAEVPMPLEGIPLRVAGRNGLRIVDEKSNEHLVYVEQREGTVVLFTLTPDAETPSLRDAFYALLHTVQFEEDEDVSRQMNLPANVSSPSSSSSPPSDPFIPCGGPAHVLCPEGMYCEVREIETGIGACRRIVE